MLASLIDTASRIAVENAHIIGPAVGLSLLALARRHLGRWPDLWRFRRVVLPVIDRLADGRYSDLVSRVDSQTDIDVAEIVDSLPEKTGMALLDRESVGTFDAPPAVVREELRSMDRLYPNTLASIQFETRDDRRVWEVGSYARRPGGFLGIWQYHIRLTPGPDGGTRLWAHKERNAWRHPVRHYHAEGWSARDGVRYYRSLFADDERFETPES
jgi:hypothetical protein